MKKTGCTERGEGRKTQESKDESFANTRNLKKLCDSNRISRFNHRAAES